MNKIYIQDFFLPYYVGLFELSDGLHTDFAQHFIFPTESKALPKKGD